MKELRMRRPIMMPRAPSTMPGAMLGTLLGMGRGTARATRITPGMR